MRITKWGECGVLCAIYLGQKYDLASVGAAEIAETQGLDLQYTQQVLQRLRKGEIIESIRGSKGGYRLARPPADITLRDILYASEGDTFEIICDHSPIRPCHESPDQCSTKESCYLHQVWQELRGVIDGWLSQRKLSDLVKNSRPLKELVTVGERVV